MKIDIQKLINDSKDKSYSKLTDKKLWRYDSDDFKNSSYKGGKTQGKINANNGHAKRQFQLNASIAGKAAHAKHKELYSNWGKQLGQMVSSIKVECPYCGKIGQRAAMGKWHMDNCKHKK